MATKTPKANKANKADKPKPEKASKGPFAVDKNWLLKRFQKHLAKDTFPDDANYGDRLKFKKRLHGVGTLEKTKAVEGVTPEQFDKSLAAFIDGFAKK